LKTLRKISLSSAVLAATILLSGCSGSVEMSPSSDTDISARGQTQAIAETDNNANEAPTIAKGEPTTSEGREPASSGDSEPGSVGSGTVDPVKPMPEPMPLPVETIEPDIGAVDPDGSVSDNPEPWLKHSDEVKRGDVVRQTIDFEDGSRANCVIYESHTAAGSNMQCNWGM
jgi:hypothetical protein